MKTHSFLISAVSISFVSLVYIFFYFLKKSNFFLDLNNSKLLKETARIRLVLLHRLSGVFLFGLLPFFVITIVFKSPIDKFGFLLQFRNESLPWIFGLGLIIVLINKFAAKSQKNLSVYPQIRAKEWNFQLIVLSTLSWMAYLLAYEFMFRGFLLFSCVQNLSLISAITINVILYSLAHLPKSIGETIGAVPLGIIFCLLTFHFGTIWPAFWIHCFMALSNEWYSIKYHPEIKVKIFKHLLKISE